MQIIWDPIGSQEAVDEAHSLYEVHIGDLADMDLEDLMQQLSDYLLDSGFQRSDDALSGVEWRALA
jgi:1,4-alpha-glucan branching enzyme